MDKTIFQRKKIETRHVVLPQLIIRDIDNDQKPETLYCIQTTDQFGEGAILCINNKGKLLWKYETGRQITCGSRVYSDDFRIYGFDVFDINNDGKLEIIIISVHYPYFPCQFLILSSRGEKLGEFWNSGFFTDFACFDLDKDGKMEIIVGGQNNEYKKRCLAIFDSENIAGASPQIYEQYKIDGIEAGSEKFYILLPRTDADILENSSSESVERIEILKDGGVRVVMAVSDIHYEFEDSLGLRGITLSHGFEQLDEKYFRLGKLKSELNDEYLGNLEKNIQYYNGEEFVNCPAMTSDKKE